MLAVKQVATAAGAPTGHIGTLGENKAILVEKEQMYWARITVDIVICAASETGQQISYAIVNHDAKPT